MLSLIKNDFHLFNFKGNFLCRNILALSSFLIYIKNNLKPNLEHWKYLQIRFINYNFFRNIANNLINIFTAFFYSCPIH